MTEIKLTIAAPIENKRLKWLDDSLSQLHATLHAGRLAHGANHTELTDPYVACLYSTDADAIIQVLAGYDLLPKVEG